MIKQSIIKFKERDCSFAGMHDSRYQIAAAIVEYSGKLKEHHD